MTGGLYKNRKCKYCKITYTGSSVFCSAQCKNDSIFATKEEQEKKIKMVQLESSLADGNSHTWRIIGEEYFKVQLCDCCGKEFLRKNPSTGSRVCSAKCRDVLRVKNTPIENIECKECATMFLPNLDNRIFCSQDCISKYIFKERIYNKKFISFTIFQRDKFSCVYCGSSPTNTPGTTLVIDHIYPISRGGKNDLFNLATACFKCNQSKRDIVFSEEQIIELWKRCESGNRSNLVISDTYDQMVVEFDKLYRKRLKAV